MPDLTDKHQERLDTWAVVELFGHTRIAGKVREDTIAGGTFLRVDVPGDDGAAAFTRFYGAGAVYSLTPCSEEVAHIVAQQIRAEPITVYVPEFHQRRLAPVTVDDGLDYMDPPYGDDDDDRETPDA